MLPLSFTKYHGAGNDFVLLDFSEAALSLPMCQVARLLCDRRHGVGADGLLLLLPSQRADYRMQIFNADGSEPAMCGNGIRCLADYIFRQAAALQEVAIETLHGVLRCRKVAGGGIAVDLGPALVMHWPIQIDADLVYVVNTGVPHAVIFVSDLDEVPVAVRGGRIRSHPHFAPHGVNVNFVSFLSDGTLALRTYERGVEGETLACGTGGAAAAFVAMKLHRLPSSLRVKTRSFLELHFNFPCNAQGQDTIEMIGSADLVFKGVIENILHFRHVKY